LRLRLAFCAGAGKLGVSIRQDQTDKGELIDIEKRSIAMLTATERQTLRSRLEKYEGKVSHMYLDSNGYVTVGVGHLVNSVAEAQKLAFQTEKSMPASAAEIKSDYESVKKQSSNRLASFYKEYTKLVLPDAEIDKLTNQHIDSFEKELKLIYSGYDSLPSEVKMALLDLIFNVGMTRLKNNWPTFNAAINAKDWQKAADNSSRTPPISAERNNYVKDLLEKAAKATQAKTS
jgi:GH24 family phage-related lysozyme (muramidase)